MKKKYLTFVFIIVLQLAKTQVSIEKAITNEAAILDFPALIGSEGNGGIAIPRAKDTTGAGVSPGTFVVDSSTKKVRFYGDSVWEDLTLAKTTDIVPYASNLSEVGGGVHISDNTINENLTGVLTLSSEKRALQLPVVADVTQLPNPPYAGMICYDKKSKSLAIFNGEKWSFWN